VRQLRSAFPFLLALLVLAIPAWGTVQPVRTVTSAQEQLESRILQGADLHYRGQLDAARVIFEEVVVGQPNNEFCLNQLALINAKQERFEVAAALFGRVAAQSPDNTFARIWLGVLHLQRGETAEAQARFAEVLRVDPGNAGACYFLGVMAAVEHDGVSAVRWFRKAQELGSDDPETHYRLAQAFLSMDMPLNARLEFERTLAINPRHTKALHDLGWVLYNQGFGEEAKALWQRVLSLNPDDAQARTSLAKVHNDAAFAAYEQGNREKAAALWKMTLQYEHDNKAARYYLQKLDRQAIDSE